MFEKLVDKRAACNLILEKAQQIKDYKNSIDQKLSAMPKDVNEDNYKLQLVGHLMDVVESKKDDKFKTEVLALIVALNETKANAPPSPSD